MDYKVYILRMSNGQLYVGFTADIQRRLHEHELGKVASTKQRRPVKLLHYESYLLKTDAERRERFLKTTEGKRLLRMQIRDALVAENIVVE